MLAYYGKKSDRLGTAEFIEKNFVPDSLPALRPATSKRTVIDSIDESVKQPRNGRLGSKSEVESLKTVVYELPAKFRHAPLLDHNVYSRSMFLLLKPVKWSKALCHSHSWTWINENSNTNQDFFEAVMK